jgi:hypothetical protein
MLAGIGAHGRSSTFGGGAMQISRPRDFGPLMFVVGLFLILLLVTLLIGAAPQS